MVRHVASDCAYWTLPGGHVEAGETPEQAVVREVKEEVCLDVTVATHLWDDALPPDYGSAPDAVCRCYSVVCSVAQTAALGFDPEEEHLAEGDRVLQGIGWKRLDEWKDDTQVSLVLRALQANER